MGDELQYQIQSVALFWKKKKKSRSIFPNLKQPPLNQVVNGYIRTLKGVFQIYPTVGAIGGPSSQTL